MIAQGGGRVVVALHRRPCICQVPIDRLPGRIHRGRLGRWLWLGWSRRGIQCRLIGIRRRPSHVPHADDT